MFQNSSTKEKDYDFKPGKACSNESVDCSNIISSTSEGDNATPKKNIKTGGCLND